MRSNYDLYEFVSRRFKEVRGKLKLNQTEVTTEIEKMLNSGEIYIKDEDEEKKFSQTILSYIENNKPGVRKERLYILIKYYELKHDINPGYFFSDSRQVQMDKMANVFDLGGSKMTAKELQEIFDKYSLDRQKIDNDIIGDIVEALKNR